MKVKVKFAQRIKIWHRQYTKRREISLRKTFIAMWAILALCFAMPGAAWADDEEIVIITGDIMGVVTINYFPGVVVTWDQGSGTHGVYGGDDQTPGGRARGRSDMGDKRRRRRHILQR